MLNEIDAVLSRYDAGEISRRDVLASLLAIALPSTARQQAVAPLVGRATQLNHATLYVQSVERSQEFYQWLLIEALPTLKLAPGPVGDHYKKLLRATGKPKATVAAARKFCTYLYWMLKEEWSYTEWLRQHDRSEVRPMQPLGSAA